MAITLEETGETILTGPVVDAAALYGLLKKVHDLGMPLISVNQVQTGQADDEAPDSIPESTPTGGKRNEG
jgi:hypothetical protein